MAEITNFLNRPLHVYQVMNNAMAGGVLAINATGASNATGGFAVATAALSNGLFTITYNAFSGTPVIQTLGVAPATDNFVIQQVRPVVVGPSSAQMQAMSNAGAASAATFVSTGVTCHVLMYGNRTGTGIS